jgi:hypothetical protein
MKAALRAIGFVLMALLVIAAPASVYAQSALLQGGPITAGHVPVYINSYSQQPVVTDSGPAGGGPAGTGLSELGITASGNGTAPYANAGTGNLGTNFCDYDAPTTNATGYHSLCFSPNAQGGGLIAYNAFGTASALPFTIEVNGQNFTFPGYVNCIGCGTMASQNANNVNITGGTINGFATSALGVPVYQAASLGGVVADTGADQAANINAAIAAMPANGGKLLLPCGNITVGSVITLSKNRVTLGSADNAYCSHLNAATTFLTGDFMVISGVYSGVDGLAFDVLPTSAQTAGGLTAFRTSGYTVHMDGGYNFLTHASMRGCFECVEMASTGNYSIVRDVVMEYIADGTANPGSGGIDVTNLGIGPENWIEDNYILPNYGAAVVYKPTFGIRIENAGVTHMSNNDVTYVGSDLEINPGSGQTVQATFSSHDVWDAASGYCAVIAPSGSGYVFNTVFTNDWCTGVAAGAIGVDLIGSGTPPSGRPASIMTTKWIGGSISSTAGSTFGQGFEVANSDAIDTDLSGASISGWDFGFFLGAAVSHVSIDDNSIGNYSFFGVSGSTTNNIGGNVASGAGDWINIHDNRFYANTSSALGFSATGTHNRVHDNPGYNPVGAGAVTVGASPWTFTTGPTETNLYIYGGTVSSVSYLGEGLCTSSPCQVTLSPYQSVVVTYSAVPTVVQSVH